MGKRKSSKQATKKASYVLPVEFDCPFCNFDKCVEIKMFAQKSAREEDRGAQVPNLQGAVRLRGQPWANQT